MSKIIKLIKQGMSENNVKPEGEEVKANEAINEELAKLQAENEKMKSLYLGQISKQVEWNPELLLDLDPKDRDSIIHSKFWVQSLEELKALYWENYVEGIKASKESDNKNEEKESSNSNSDSEFEKRARLTEYRLNQMVLKEQMKVLKESNSDLFELNPDAEEKIKEKMQLLKGNDLEENVSLAFQLAKNEMKQPEERPDYTSMKPVIGSGGGVVTPKPGTHNPYEKAQKAKLDYIFTELWLNKTK